MPESLPETLKKMKALYDKDATQAVRGQGFIKLLHHWCGEQLAQRLKIPAHLREKYIKYEYKTYGAYKRKQIDVAVVHPEAGELILVSVKSQLKSINKNIDTMFEGLIGDATNIHEKYPLCTFGFLYLLPTVSLDENNETPAFEKVIKLLQPIANRKDSQDLSGKYEKASLFVVDFSRATPTISKAIPNPRTEKDIRYDDFFDVLVSKFWEQNKFIEFK